MLFITTHEVLNLRPGMGVLDRWRLLVGLRLSRLVILLNLSDYWPRYSVNNCLLLNIQLCPELILLFRFLILLPLHLINWIIIPMIINLLSLNNWQRLPHFIKSTLDFFLSLERCPQWRLRVILTHFTRLLLISYPKKLIPVALTTYILLPCFFFCINTLPLSLYKLFSCSRFLLNLHASADKRGRVDLKWSIRIDTLSGSWALYFTLSQLR